MDQPYLTINEFGQHQIEIKKSKFICTLAPIKSEKQAKEIINQITQDNKKANHNCYAYLIGDKDQIVRESDNGEPSGTAGVPILEVLKKNQLHDTLAIVTRYFGGIKLGAGGLIRAYSNATSEAIEHLGMVQLVQQQSIEFTIEYNQYDRLKYYLENHDLEISDVNYQAKISVTIYIDVNEATKLVDQVTELFNGQVTSSLKDQKIVAVPYNK